MITKRCLFYVALLQIQIIVTGRTMAQDQPVVDREVLRRSAVKQLDARISLDLLTRALSATKDAKVQTSLMRGMLSGLEGRRNVSAPKGWVTLSSHLEKNANADVIKLARRLSQIFGDKTATAKTLATLRNRKAPITDRREALKSLVTQQNEETKKELEKLLDEPALRVDAIRAYSALEDERAPGILLSRYSDLDFQGQRAVIETLATRKNYSHALIAAIGSKKVPRKDVPVYIARSLHKQHGKKFTAAYGNIAALSKDKEALIAKYKGLLNPRSLATANASQGRTIFQRTCAPCHVIYGEGGKIGPDLTGSNRADLDYILLNMLDPSGDIPDAYKLITITTKGGQLLAGTIAEEDDQRIVLNMVGQRSTVLKNDIKTRDIAPISMMPEGLLPTLKNAEVIDLVRYLQSTQQVSLPK